MKLPANKTAPSVQTAWGLSALGKLLILIGMLNIVFILDHAIEGDGAVRWQFLDHLLSEGKALDVKYSMIGPLFSAPLWFIGKILGNKQELLVSYSNALLFIAAVFLMRKHLIADVSERVADIFALLLLSASMFPHHAGRYYAELFSSLVFFIGLLRLSRSADSTMGWCLLVLSTANTPASIGGLFLVCCYYCIVEKRLRYFGAILAVVCFVLLENWIKSGHPFHSGYEGDHGFQTMLPYSGQPGFSYPFFFGIISILLSFGKGLVFFAPGLLLARKNFFNGSGALQRLMTTSYLYLLGLIVLYAKWWAWYGGIFWGPRFFLFASLPASLLLALAIGNNQAKLFRGVLIGTILILSVWVGINGMVFKEQGLDICTRNNYALELLCWYTPEFSALWHPFTTGQVWQGLGKLPSLYAVTVLIVLLIHLFRSVPPAVYGDIQAKVSRVASSLKKIRF